MDRTTTFTVIRLMESKAENESTADWWREIYIGDNKGDDDSDDGNGYDEPQNIPHGRGSIISNLNDLLVPLLWERPVASGLSIGQCPIFTLF